MKPHLHKLELVIYEYQKSACKEELFLKITRFTCRVSPYTEVVILFGYVCVFSPWAGLSCTSSSLLYWVTCVYRVERSRGQLFFLHVAWTSAVRYDSGMCNPDNHITMGSPSSTYTSHTHTRQTELEILHHKSLSWFLQCSI